MLDRSENDIGKFRQALPQFLAVGVKNSLLFVYGMTLGFPTIVIPAIQGGEGREPSDIVLSREEISWFSSINLICVPLGCVFSGIFSQPIGKRRAMQIVNFPILASWLLFHFSTNIFHLYIGLCLFGLSGGLMEAPVLTYVAEITEPKYRGLLSASGSAAVMIGVFIQFILGSLLDWRTVAAVCTIFPVISFLALFFVPESPTWLIRKNKLEEAVKSLQWLRGWVCKYRVENEFLDLYNYLQNQKNLDNINNSKHKSKIIQRLLLFKKRSFFYPFSLIGFCFFIGHFSGKTTLQTYAVQIFHTLKVPLDKYYATVLMGLVEVIGTILCVILIHFTGKRPLVFVSTLGCGFCFLATATYAYYLNVVPGFAVSNVVASASSLLSNDSIINVNNLTEIFKIQEKILIDKEQNFFLNDTFDFDINSTTVFSNIKEEESPLIKYHEFDTSIELINEIDKITNQTNKDEYYFNFENESFIPEELISNNTETKNMITLHENEEHDSKIDISENILVPLPNQKKNKYLWVPLILLLGSAFFAHLGIRLIPWMLIGEVYPASIRNTASGISGAIGYIFGFLANKVFLQMITTLTLPGTFWFYSFIAISGTIVLYFILPETEGRTLADIEKDFRGIKSHNETVNFSDNVQNQENSNCFHLSDTKLNNSTETRLSAAEFFENNNVSSKNEITHF